jgi:hypothetical protein
MNAPPAKKSNTLLIVLIVAGVGLLAIVVVVGILAATGVYGASRYMSQAKAAEGRAQAQALARGMAACGDKNRDEGKSEVLPATSPAVPPSLASLKGTKYMSVPADWKDPSYDCARFSISVPQYFQYQWVRDRPDHGAAKAIADLDADGSPDRSFEVEVSCSATACTTGMLSEK